MANHTREAPPVPHRGSRTSEHEGRTDWAEHARRPSKAGAEDRSARSWRVHRPRQQHSRDGYGDGDRSYSSRCVRPAQAGQKHGVGGEDPRGPSDHVPADDIAGLAERRIRKPKEHGAAIERRDKERCVGLRAHQSEKSRHCNDYTGYNEGRKYGSKRQGGRGPLQWLSTKLFKKFRKRGS